MTAEDGGLKAWWAQETEGSVVPADPGSLEAWQACGLLSEQKFSNLGTPLYKRKIFKTANVQTPLWEWGASNVYFLALDNIMR